MNTTSIYASAWHEDTWKEVDDEPTPTTSQPLPRELIALDPDNQ